MPVVRISRYEFATPHQDEQGRKFLDVPDPPIKKIRRDDTRVVVGTGDTLFTLAWRAYKSMLNREQDIRPTSFFDVIAQMSDVVDAAAPLPEGKEMRVPSVRAIQEEIRVPPPFFRRNTVT